MTLISEVDFDGVVLNGVRIARGERLSSYEQILGLPSRSLMPGPPPPYGHRNNVIHFYDDAGLLLREHHATYLIEGIDFLLEPKRCKFFQTRSSLCGLIRVFGVEVRREMEFGDFAVQCSVPFKPHLGHAWFADGEFISIQFEVYRRNTNHPLERGVISRLCVGFRWAHRPENAPPTVPESG